ncbi:unnamed protein product [Laminaria digitata]
MEKSANSCWVSQQSHPVGRPFSLPVRQSLFAHADFLPPPPSLLPHCICCVSSSVGVDPALSGKPSSALEAATTKAQDMGLTLRGVGGVAEDLPFDSGSFDAVVSTLVFCSVVDPSLALREVSRVLRPGGKFLFVEHIHAQEEGLSIFGLRQQQDLLDPLQQQVADGCHLTRETDRLVKNAVGGPSESRLFSRVESIETVRVNGMWPVSEQVFGVVVK